MSSSEALTEREANETVIARCSSEEVSRILASAVEEDENEMDGGVDDDEDVAEWRQVIQDMTESIDSLPPFTDTSILMNLFARIHRRRHREGAT